MPLVMQQWNIYRSRAIGHWLQENGVSVIPDIRFGNERTYEVSCAGIQKHGTIAVGSHGCIKLLSERSYFVSGLEYVVSRLEPSTLVVYGAAPDKIFAPYREKGIEVLQFDSDFMIVWLEKGNSTAGLEHIVNGNGRTSGHAKDFERAFGVSKAQIPNYLNKVISQGEIVKNSLIKRGNRECFERIYYYEGKHYVVTGIGTNGFIVSAYPKKMKGDR